VPGNAWLLAQSAAGTRRVQEAVEEASEEGRIALLEEFRGHGVKAMRDPHANHVLQQCVRLVEPMALQFLVDELLEREGLAANVARHRYGGRVVQQLLKRCGAEQVSELAEVLMQEATNLACHSFGNFSVQNLLTSGTQEQRRRVARAIAKDAGSLCRSRAGDGVVAVAMEHAEPEDRLLIAHAILAEPGTLVELAQGRHGHGAALRLLQVLDAHESLQAHMILAEAIGTLRASRYGRIVARHMEESMK